jgi:hypothetical protein
MFIVADRTYQAREFSAVVTRICAKTQLVSGIRGSLSTKPARAIALDARAVRTHFAELLLQLGTLAANQETNQAQPHQGQGRWFGDDGHVVDQSKQQIHIVGIR